MRALMNEQIIVPFFVFVFVVVVCFVFCGESKTENSKLVSTLKICQFYLLHNTQCQKLHYMFDLVHVFNNHIRWIRINLLMNILHFVSHLLHFLKSDTLSADSVRTHMQSALSVSHLAL